MAGPGLFNVLGRPVAGLPGFGYSQALASVKANGKTWSAAELDMFLKDPGAYAPGTTMPVNVANAGDRHALIAYLATVRGKAAQPRIAAAAKAAGGEHWSDDHPGRIHHVRASDLAKPFATESAGNPPVTVPRPASVLPSVPAGFKVNLWSTDPDRGRIMAKAPNGDIFLGSMSRRVIKVLRSSDGEKADTVSTFASDMNRPFGFAFWPVGPNPQ